MDLSLKMVVFKLNGEQVPFATSVALAGSFNHWDASAYRLVRGPDEWWGTSDALPTGRYPCLLVVDDLA